MDENTDPEEHDYPDLTSGDRVSDRPSEGVDLTVQETPSLSDENVRSGVGNGKVITEDRAILKTTENAENPIINITMNDTVPKEKLKHDNKTSNNSNKKTETRFTGSDVDVDYR